MLYEWQCLSQNESLVNYFKYQKKISSKKNLKAQQKEINIWIKNLLVKIITMHILYLKYSGTN